MVTFIQNVNVVWSINHGMINNLFDVLCCSLK